MAVFYTYTIQTCGNFPFFKLVVLAQRVFVVQNILRSSNGFLYKSYHMCQNDYLEWSFKALNKLNFHVFKVGSMLKTSRIQISIVFKIIYQFKVQLIVTLFISAECFGIPLNHWGWS